MGHFSDRFATEYNDHLIEVENHLASPIAGASALFVDNERVDYVGHFSLFGTSFSLRHNISDKNKIIKIMVMVKQGFTTKAKLFIYDVEHDFSRIK